MRKFTITLFLWVWVCNAFAQVPSCTAPIALSDQFRTMLHNLDKSQIPTGILYENVFPWAEIESYDGTFSTDTSSFPHFLQAYSEVYASKYNTFNDVHPSDFETAIKNFHSDKEYHHPYGIIDYQYNTIKSDAVANNLLSVTNGQLFDVASRTESPYLTKNVSMGSILLADGTESLSPGKHYIHFSPDFVKSNTGFTLNDVQNLKIYIDGNLVLDSTVTGLANSVVPIIIDAVNAPVIITVTLTVAIIYGNFKLFKGLFSKKEKFPLTACQGSDELVVTGASFDGGYGQGASAAKGRANIFYANANCAAKRLTKPIIFVDGFDPTNAQHGAELWGKYINRVITNSDLSTSRLGDSLLANGYDIITFDQADEGFNQGGGGFMENNALALVKLLETLYAQHSNTLQDDFVVVGASMGGLVARYALTYMEHNKIPHHTRLFVSFDSPQLGAQIPVGVQQFIDLIGQYGGLKSFGMVKEKAVHLTNAAKQLLVHHSTAESETVQSHPFRNIFINNLNNIGSWPNNLRKIAIVDGNKNGIIKSVTPVPAPPGFEALYSCGYELDFGIKRRLFKNCTAANCYKLHSQSFTQTSDNRCKSLDFTVNNNTNLLKLIFTSGQFTKQSLYTQTLNNTSNDLAPGARFGVDPLGSINGWVKAFSFIITGHLKIENNLIPHTNFISTVSSAAYTFPNNEPFNVYKNLQGVTLSVCAGTTHFDTVYAPNQDLNHVEINEEIANWFKSEIYFPKQKSNCPIGNCPEYLTLNTPLLNNSTGVYKASKAILMEPTFEAPNGSVITAEIGCNNPMSKINKYENQNTTNSILPICTFDWEYSQTEIDCNSGSATNSFKIFVNRYFDITSYPEFSIDNITWFKANLGDKGAQWLLLNNPGQPQIFYARPHNDPNNIISITLNYCN